jgi:hypothetical protein
MALHRRAAYAKRKHILYVGEQVFFILPAGARIANDPHIMPGSDLRFSKIADMTEDPANR